MKSWFGDIIQSMENFNQNNQNENKETGWEIAAEDQRAVIEAQIRMLEAQRLELESRMREELQYMRNANRDEMDNQDIYESMSDIFEDKMRAYDSKFYEIDVQIDGLEFKLKNIENNRRKRFRRKTKENKRDKYRYILF